MNFLPEFKKYLFSQSKPSSKVTVKNYISDISRFVRWFEKIFGSFSPDLVTPQVIEQFKKSNNGTISSLERNLSSLRKFFHFLELEGHISSSPFQQLSNQAMEQSDPYRLKDFKNYLYVYNASKLTIKNYLMDIKKFLSWLEEVTDSKNAWDVKEKDVLGSIDNYLIEEYKRRLPYSPRTVNRKLSSLRKYLKWAEEEGIIQTRGGEVEGLPTTRMSVFRERALAGGKPRQDPERAAGPRYSSFPPFRLVQKTLRATLFLPEFILINPLSKVLKTIEYLKWRIEGKPVFERLKDRARAKIRIKSLPKEVFAPFAIATTHLPFHRRLLFHIAHTRPNWYKRYHEYSFSHYFHLAILMLVMSAIGFGIYQNLFPVKTQGVLGFANPQVPPRILSFQGKLKDSSDNPITSSTNLRFALYDSLTGTGSALLWQEVDTVTPDSDGIFSLLLGNRSTMGQDLFAMRAGLWLGVTVGQTAELTPRQRLATVDYAENADNLQGLPPITQSGTGTSNVVLALDSSGNLTIGGSATPTFQATGGQFTLSGNPLLLTTTSGSNANVKIAPNGRSFIDLQKPLQNSTKNNNISSALGAVEVDSLLAVLATSSGQSALTINQNGAGPLLSASTSGTAKFTVDNSGNTTIAAGSGFDAISAGSLGVGNTTATTLNLGNTAATTIAIGAGGSLTRTINIGTGTGADTINIGTGGTTADTIAIGGLSSTAINTTGALTHAGTFSQTGANTFSTGTGAVSLNGNTTITGTESVSSTLSVTGATTLSSTLSVGGNLTFSTDNSFDIGASGATRPRTGYFGTSVFTGGAVGVGTTSPTAGNGLTIAPSARTSGTPSLLTVTGPADTTLTAAEAIDVNWNLARTVQFTGSTTAGAANITTQRATLIQAPTYSFSSTGAQTITNGTTLALTGAPLGSTNTTITNGAALRISASAVTNTTNAYGLYVDAPTGATNNYAATFASGNVGIGTSSPIQPVDVIGIIQARNTSASSYEAITLRPRFDANSHQIDVEWSAGASARRLDVAFGGTPKVTFDTNGNVGIGTTGPTHQLQLSTDDAAKTTTTTWTTTSDVRTKTNITPFTSGLDVLTKLNPIEFDYNGLGGTAAGVHSISLIAQDTKPIAPYLIGSFKGKLNPEDTQDSEILTFNPHGIFFLTINSIKELNNRLNTLFKTSCVTSQSSSDFGLVKNICSQTTIGKIAGSASYAVKNYLGEVATGGQILAEAVIGTLRAGLIQTKELIADNITVNNKIISPIAEVETVRTDTISPLSSNKVVVKLDALASSASQSGKPSFEIQNASGSAVTSITDKGDASFSGRLSAKSASISGSLSANGATISGTLKAKNIIADNIESQILNLKSSILNLGKPASPSATPIPIANGIPIAGVANIDTLNAQVGTFMQGLFAVGPTSLSDATVFGQLSVGANLILANGSINVLGSDLKLQPLGQGGILLGKKIAIDNNGNLNVNGDAKFNGTLFANIISPIPGNDLIFKLLNKNASDSAQFKVVNASGSAVASIDANGDATFRKLSLKIVSPAFALSEHEVIATGSAGIATISAQFKELTIDNKLVTDKSLIYITPVGTPSDQVPYLLRQVPGTSFTVGTQDVSGKELPFNWLIIN